MIRKIVQGISAYGEAIKHISKHGMWAWVLLPGILSLLIGIAIFGTAWGLSDNLGGYIDNLWRWEWGKSVVETIAQVFGAILILAVGLLIFKQIIMVLLAPIMSLLSEKVENQLRGDKIDRPFTLQQILSDIIRGLRIALRNIIRELFATAILFLLGLIPVLTPFTSILIFLLQSYYAGFGNMDYTLERHFGYRDSIRFVKRNRSAALGNGIVFMAMLLTFFGFLFALPLGTVAATLQTVKQIEEGN